MIKAEKEIEKYQNPDKPKKTSTASKAAKTKKIKKQIEGLDLLKDVMSQITGSGVAACADKAFDKKYDELAKQLGDYYLPGVQIIFKRFLKYLRTDKDLIELENTKQKDSEYYNEEFLFNLVVKELTKLRYIEKRARDYLNKKLESDSTG